MLEFDIEEVLEELEDKSAKGKIKALNELYDELAEAQNVVQSEIDEIEDEYISSVQEQLTEAIQSHIKEHALADNVSIGNGVCDTTYNDNQVQLFSAFDGADWTIQMRLKNHIIKNSVRFQNLAQLAELTGTSYKNGNDSINLSANEENLIQKFVEIIDKICKVESQTK